MLLSCNQVPFAGVRRKCVNDGACIAHATPELRACASGRTKVRPYGERYGLML